MLSAIILSISTLTRPCSRCSISRKFGKGHLLRQLLHLQNNCPMWDYGVVKWVTLVKLQ